MYIFLLATGVLCLLYFFRISFLLGHLPGFYDIWLLLGSLAIVFSLLWKKGFFAAHVPLWLRRTFMIFVCLGLALFLFVEGCIVSGFFEKGSSGADYVVVLGAQMKAGGPSKALQYRLDAAVSYLDENPDAMVIVSGGKGRDEPVSEAQGMYAYLVEQGIEKERILLEDRSRNTWQNLTFSAQLLDREKDRVAVVSNNFHVFRALRIARKAGYRNVCGIAAKGEPFLQCNNMLREFFGVMKDLLCGNL